MSTNRIWRTALLAASASVLFCTTVPGLAHADPQGTKSEPGSVTNVSDALKRDLKMSVDQFNALGDAAAQLSAFSDKANPDSLAFVKLSDGKPVVVLKTNAPHTAELKEQAQKAKFEVSDSEYSKQDVDNDLVDVNNSLNTAPPEVKNLILGKPIAQYNRGAVAINVDGVGSADKVAKQFAKLDANIRYIEVTSDKTAAPKDGPNVTINPTDSSLKPGSEYLAKSDTKLSSCSVAFPAVDKNKHSLILTAGHCGTGGTKGTQVLQQGERVGDFVSQAFGTTSASTNGYDYAVANINKKLTEGDKLTPALTDATTPVQGQPICRLSHRTGVVCGTLTETNTSLPINSDTKDLYVTGFVTDVCSLPGDSGGAFISGTHALGIVSAGATSDNCKIGQKSLTLGTPVKSVLDASYSDQAKNAEYGAELKLFK